MTLRKKLLKHLGVAPGNKTVIEPIPDELVESRAAQGSRKISEVFGVLKQVNGPRLTIDEINEAIAKGWAGET